MNDRSILRWGGLAGMLSPLFTLLTAVTLFGFIPQAPADTYGVVMRYPEVKTAYAVGETFSLISNLLAVAFYMALYRALREKSSAPALWGVGVAFLGLATLAVQSVPRVALGKISDLYHAPGVSAQEQATLALIWDTTQGLFLEWDTAALILIAVTYILFGIAMLKHPAFGSRYGAVTIVLAFSALVANYLLGIESLVFAPLGLFVFIALPLLLASKLFVLSRST